MKKLAVLFVTTAVLCLHAATASININEDFASDPLASSRWTFGAATSNANSQFAWSATASAYTGDAAGSLQVHLNSTLPTARVDRALGGTVTQEMDFSLVVRFSFVVSQALQDQGIQMAFGLVNSALTGIDRTGSFADFTSDDVYHTVEFTYFPNKSTFNASTPGPTLSPAVFGAQKGDAFGNFAAVFLEGSDLGGNTSGITELPQDQTLEATLAYTGLTHLLTLTMKRVESNGSLTLLDTGLPAMDLDTPPQFSTYDTGFPFAVDSLAIMAYHDGFTDPLNASLIADMKFQSFQFDAVPEPSAAMLLLAGAIALVLRRRETKEV